MSCTRSNNNTKDIEDIINDDDKFKFPKEKEPLLISLVKDLVKDEFDNKKEYTNKLIDLRRKYHVHPSKSQMLLVYNKYLVDQYPLTNKMKKLMTKKASRGNSGIIQITSTMAPEWTIDIEDPITKTKTRKIKKFTCSFDCDFCPDERDEYGVQTQPRSYLSREPAMLRALRMKFDAFDQFKTRADTYIANGHKVDKVEFIALGGTFNCYDSEYREKFIAETYHSANVLYTGEERNTLSLQEEIKINETAKCGIIGITLETRPDMINDQAILDFRKYNCTRVQIGIQSLNDEVLKINNRKCYLKDTIKAIRKLKGVGLKVVGHYMPDLPGSSPEIDEKVFMQAVSDPNVQLDDWKIYPTAVVPYTKIEKKYKEGLYKPYTEDNPSLLVDMMVKIKPLVPKWVRIERLIRDIPSTYIEAGYNGMINMRQIIHNKMKEKGVKCHCLRCMEVRDRVEYIPKAKFALKSYKDDHGTEYFLTYEACDCDFCWRYLLFTIYRFFRQLLRTPVYWQGCPNYSACMGFCRLRHDINPGLDIIPEIKNCALIRELHVYGQMLPADNKNKNKVAQHAGFGRKLMQKAEEISYSNGWKKTAVIAGTGVRPYYQNKCGYHKEGTYMIKNLSQTNSYTQKYLNFMIILISLIIFYIFNYHI